MATAVRMAKVDVLFVILSLSLHMGLEGSNYNTVLEVGAYVSSRGLPYVIMGDWNMTSEEVALSGLS